MNQLEEYRELNSHLAKTVNELKCELRKSNDQVISLHRQLQLVHETSAHWTVIFDCVDQFERHLDECFAQHAFDYIRLSQQINEITSMRPKKLSVNDSPLNATFDANETFAIDKADEGDSTFAVDSSCNDSQPKSAMVAELAADISSRGRRVKRINYREAPINRKMRRNIN